MKKTVSIGALLASTLFVSSSITLAESDGAGTAPPPAYATQCSGCHGGNLQGTFGPALAGDAFRAKWAGKVDELRSYIAAQMPPGQAGVLSAAQYDAVTKYIADSNKLGDMAAAGAEPASDTAGASSEGVASGGAFGDSNYEDDAYRAEMQRREKVLADMSDVTDKQLLAPAPGDWLHWRRTYDVLGVSPLTGLTPENVSDLSMKWSLALPPGTNQIDPLVHDGVMFVNSAGTVVAIEAATGTTLWHFSRPASAKPLGPPSTNPRSMAIYGNKLFVPTMDNHMLALDMRTGKLVWDHKIEGRGDMLRIAGGPMIVNGKVLQGISGCAGNFVPGGCFIVALDAESGNELWRFQTLAKPGSPDDSWNGEPEDARVGGSVWTSGSYDQSTGLVYFGTGQTYRITPLMAPLKPGERNDALYTDTTLALDPDTGKLVWFYQHQKREVWDLDWAFERTLATMQVKGKPRRVVMTMGKIGMLDVLDAKTGEYLFTRDMGLQDLISHVDPETGEKTLRPGAEPIADKAVPICPFPAGIRNFPATSYDQKSGLLYIPAVESCMNFMWRPKETAWDLGYQMTARPDAGGKYGRLEAMSVDGKNKGWTVRRRAGASSAVLLTKTGLLFEGTLDRYFRAMDASTGKELWSTRLPDVPNAFPVTFLSGGKQCVSITTGGGGPMDATFRAFLPEAKNPANATILLTFCER
ncbi:MAG: PQQ-binding-like beta-propeller repeat protein [Novosphingobium sp.]|nr:PQQ-binding-like beta-propeller repeat protein [Novosphingobium sp.]